MVGICGVACFGTFSVCEIYKSDGYSLLHKHFLLCHLCTLAWSMPSSISVIVDSPVIIMYLYDLLSPNCIERTKMVFVGI